VDIPRLPPEDDPRIKARQNLAGRFGFILGCIAAASAIGINLYRAARPWDVTAVILAVLMAALNMPLGIMLGLLGEKLTRPKRNRPPKR
jgi:hypothetical protein